MEKGQEFKILDNGYIKVIDWMGSEETIIEAARMSTGKGFISWDPYKQCTQCGYLDFPVPGSKYSTSHYLDGDPPEDMVQHEHTWKESKRGDLGLLEYLYKNVHMTPFEMCELSLEVQAPIFVFREWMRHRSQSFNEFSARYSEMPNIHYVPAEGRFEPKKTANKQESSSESSGQMSDGAFCKLMTEEYQQSIYKSYKYMLEHGVPKEVARINTPVSRYSRMRVKANLRNWLGFLLLRMAPNAQLEIREYANVIGNQIIAALWPKVWNLFLEYDFHATKVSRYELKVLHSMIRDLLSKEELEAYSQSMPSHRAKDFLTKFTPPEGWDDAENSVS